MYYGSSDGGDADHYNFKAFEIDPAEGAPVRLQLSRSAQDRTLVTLPEEDTACWVFETPVKTTKHLWIWAHPVGSDDVLQMVRFQMYSLPSFYQNIEAPSRLCLVTTWAEPIVKLTLAIAPMGPAPPPATPKKQRKAPGGSAPSSASSSASSSPLRSFKKLKVASSSADPVSAPAATVIVAERALADDPDPSAYYADDLIDLLQGTISQSNIQLAGRKERLSEWVHMKTLAGKELQVVLLDTQLETLKISEDIHAVQGEHRIFIFPLWGGVSAASR